MSKSPRTPRPLVDDDAVEVGYVEYPSRKEIVLNGYSLRRIQEDRDRQAKYLRNAGMVPAGEVGTAMASDNGADTPEPDGPSNDTPAPTVEDLVEAVQRRYPIMNAWELTILRDLLTRTYRIAPTYCPR